MPRPRVLTVVDAAEVGGMDSHLTSSMGRLARSRYDLRVANLGRAAPLADRLRSMKIRVYDLEVEGTFAPIRRVLALRRLIRQLDIAVVHSYGRSGPIARIAAGRVPTVSTLPDRSGESSGWRGRVRAYFEERAARRAARLLVPSAVLKRHYSQRWGVAVEVMPSFLDLAAIRERLAISARGQERTRLGVGADEVVLLFIAGRDSGGGLDAIIEAFQLARVEHGALRLLITGTEAEIASGRARAEALDLADAVVFLGQVDDVMPLFVAADVFVLPSCPEGWSMGLLEAMAAGLPVVSAADEDLPEPATDATLVLADDPRPESIARGILRLAANPRLRRELGAAAAKRVSKVDAGVWAPRLEKIYAEVIRASAG